MYACQIAVSDKSHTIAIQAFSRVLLKKLKTETVLNF